MREWIFRRLVSRSVVRKVRKMRTRISLGARFRTTCTCRIWRSYNSGYEMFYVLGYINWRFGTKYIDFKRIAWRCIPEDTTWRIFEYSGAHSGALQDRNALLSWNRMYWIPFALISPYSFLFQVKVAAFETGSDVFLQRSQKAQTREPYFRI
jgi:hypothetical protein